MNKILITLAGTLALLATGMTYAQDAGDGPDGPPMHKKHRMHNMHGAPGPERVFRALKRLDLDETQQAAIREIAQNMRADLKPIMKEMHAGQMQLRDQIHSGTMDEEAIAAIAQKEGDLTAERIMITSKAISSALNQLTDEQRAELQAMAEERRAKRLEKRRPKPAQES